MASRLALWMSVSHQNLCKMAHRRATTTVIPTRMVSQCLRAQATCKNTSHRYSTAATYRVPTDSRQLKQLRERSVVIAINPHDVSALMNQHLGLIPSSLTDIVQANTFDEQLAAVVEQQPSLPGLAALPIRTARSLQNAEEREHIYNTIVNGFLMDTVDALQACATRRDDRLHIVSSCWLLLECCELLTSDTVVCPPKLLNQLQKVAFETSNTLGECDITHLDRKQRIRLLYLWTKALHSTSMRMSAKFLANVLSSPDLQRWNAADNIASFDTYCAYIAALGMLKTMHTTQQHHIVSTDAYAWASDFLRMLKVLPPACNNGRFRRGHAVSLEIVKSVLLATEGFARLRLSGKHPLWESVIEWYRSSSDFVVALDVKDGKRLYEAFHSVTDLPAALRTQLHSLMQLLVGVSATSSEEGKLGAAAALAPTLKYRGEGDALAWNSLISMLQTHIEAFMEADEGTQLMQLHGIIRSFSRIAQSMHSNWIFHYGLSESLMKSLTTFIRLLDVHPMTHAEMHNFYLQGLLSVALYRPDLSLADKLLAQLREFPVRLYSLPPDLLIRAISGFAYRGALSEPLFKSFARVLDQQLKVLPIADLIILLDAIVVSGLEKSGKPAHVLRFCVKTVDQACANATNIPNDMNAFHVESLLVANSVIQQSQVVHACLHGIQLQPSSVRLCRQTLQLTGRKMLNADLEAWRMELAKVAVPFGWGEPVVAHVAEDGFLLDLAWPEQKVCVEMLNPLSLVPGSDASLYSNRLYHMLSGGRHLNSRLSSSYTPGGQQHTHAAAHLPTLQPNAYATFRQRMLQNAGWTVIHASNNGKRGIIETQTALEKTMRQQHTSTQTATQSQKK